MKTRTGGFSIGFRRGGSAWQQDLAALIAWAKENDLEVIDLGRDGDETAGAVVDAGLAVGSVDLPDWKGMISPDKGTRDTALARNAEYVQACAAYGPMNHFLVMLPEDPNRPRRENFDTMVESFSQLGPVLEENDARLVIEGWPGPGALCCTPEGFRAFFEACPSPAFGINYDPSHLLRQGIDPVRFLWEFHARVYHVHGKDTELLDENLYEYGHEQPATFTPSFRYGGWAWRYTIPGQGAIRWVSIFSILAQQGYGGTVSIELEDANFNGSEEGEKFGILQGATFLAGC
ncbi:MAG: sugar phosphate isomerase/epimerase family protein [Anaerolineae bacterium]